MKYPIRTVELFAGVGGFRLGLESASNQFKIIWANQWEPAMREQYAFDCYILETGKVYGTKSFYVDAKGQIVEDIYVES